jgi:hypothetical protein
MELRVVPKSTAYWVRPDLGISADDIRMCGRAVSITVHSLGAGAAPPSRVVVRDGAGREVASAGVPALEAPVDLRPRMATVRWSLPGMAELTGRSVSIEAPAA